MQQREQLYRKLEVLSSQGVLMNANPPLLISPSQPTQSMTSTSPSSPSLLLDLPSPTPSLPVSSSASMSSSTSTSPMDSYKRRHDSVRWKQQPTSSANALPLNLISATNEQKVSEHITSKANRSIECNEFFTMHRSRNLMFKSSKSYL